MTDQPEAVGRTFWADADGEQALECYRTLVKTVDDGIYQLDPEGRFVAVNDAIVEMTGYSQDELLGAHISLLLDDDAVEHVQREISQQLAADQDNVDTFELFVETADEARLPIELRMSLLLEDGGFRGTVGVARDISERKQYQERFESVLDSYESITTVINEADVGVFVLNDSFEVAWIDNTAERYFGLDREAMIGRDKRELIEETIQHRVADGKTFAETVLSTYEDNSYVERFECRMTPGEDREGRWLEHRSKPIEMGEYAGGRIELYYDITDQKQSQGALRESEEEFFSLVDAVEEYAIFRLDSDGHVISWNNGAREIKGYEAEEILGEHFSTFYTEQDRKAGVPEQNLKKATDNDTIEDEGWRVKEDGTRFWANVTITAIREGGTHRGYLKVARDMTDRYQREQELENELQRIYGRISDAFYAVDKGYRLTHVNERAEQILDADREKLVGTNFWEAFPEIEGTTFETRYREAMATQDSVSFEEYYPPNDAWFEVHVYPSETGLSVYFRDVTERIEREQELERTLDLLNKTERIADVSGWEIDPDTMELYWSDHLFELLDVDYDEQPTLEEALAVYHSEDDRAVVENAVEVGLETGEPFDVQVRFSRAVGDVGWLRVKGDPEVEDGKVVSLRGAVQDATERVERERELERRAQEQQVVADLGQFALETDDFDDLMAEAARQVATVLGNEYCKVLDLDPEAEELLLRQGVGWQEGIVGEATVSSVEADSQAAITLANEDPIVVEDVDTDARFSGPELLTSHDVKSGISTIIGPIDEAWGILGTHDTDRQEFADEDVRFVQSVANILAEAIERHRYQEELERLVGDLKESNERLEQFAYAASHDLQEPLRMVSSYLKLIDRRYTDALDEDGEEFLEFAVDGADRMREMIDGLLEYSRVETQGDPFGPVDLDAILEDAREDLRLSIEESDAEVTTDELPTVQGDVSQLRQVFLNLLDNAIEYSGDEPPRIHVGAERTGSHWVLSVCDEGIGIDPGETDRVFEVFDRLHTHEEHDGTGIGLALCERIVERHGGDIWVETEPGEGATFSFTLSPTSDPDE